MYIDILKRTLSLNYEKEGLTKDDLINEKYYRLYELSCFFYSIEGYYKIKHGYNYGYMLFIQSFLSYMNDIVTIGKPSVWNIIDRYYAMTMSMYFLYYIKKTPVNIIYNAILFQLGCHYLKKSQDLYIKGDTKFLIEHTKWHIIAPLMVISN